MGLEGQSPPWILKHRLHTSFHIDLPLGFIIRITRLQKTMRGFNAVILRQVLSEIHHLQLIALFQHAWLGIATLESSFGRKRHPIEIARQRTSAIGFNGDVFASPDPQLCHKDLVDKQRGLTASQDDDLGIGIMVDFIDDGLRTHHLPLLMLRVAKKAMQVASAETHEDRRRPSVEAFALEGVEYFINPEHLDCFVASLFAMTISQKAAEHRL